MKRSFTYLAAVVLAAAVVPAAALATSHSGGPTSPVAHAYTHGNLPADWWEWVLAQPFDKSPLYDGTGANCAEGQQGHVWFLAGSPNGQMTNRSCTIPDHTALFIPVVNNGYFAFKDDPPATRTKEYVLQQADVFTDTATHSASIDGVPVSDLVKVTTLFKLKLKADNLFGLPKGFALNPSADAGYYVLVDPLPPGQHTIHLAGFIPSINFSVDVTYTLTVEGHGHSH